MFVGNAGAYPGGAKFQKEIFFFEGERFLRTDSENRRTKYKQASEFVARLIKLFLCRCCYGSIS